MTDIVGYQKTTPLEHEDGFYSCLSEYDPKKGNERPFLWLDYRASTQSYTVSEVDKPLRGATIYNDGHLYGKFLVNGPGRMGPRELRCYACNDKTKILWRYPLDVGPQGEIGRFMLGPKYIYIFVCNVLHVIDKCSGKRVRTEALLEENDVCPDAIVHDGDLYTLHYDGTLSCFGVKS